jgi:hypothetical protein
VGGRVRALLARLAGLPRWARGLVLAVAVIAAAVVVVVALRERGAARVGGLPLADPVPYDGRSPREPSGERRRVLVELSRPSLGQVLAERPLDPGAQRAYVRSLRSEARALRSALDARGVPLQDVVSFERTWNGFAATVATEHLADISSLGVRAQPVRRFFPAASEPVATASRARRPQGAPSAGQAPVAVLDSGVDGAHPWLRGRTAPGYDAVDRDRDPAPGADPRAAGRTERSGTALAGVLAAAGERVMPIRVAALRSAAGQAGAEELATSDTLLAGLERAADPDGDGAVDDHVPVALIGVNAPYAGFATSAEAEAIGGAGDIGTLVVASAGNEGAARPPSGTVGSPGAARDALTAGALAEPGAVGRVTLTVGGVEVRAAQLAVGTAGLPARGLRTAGPVRAEDPGDLLARGAPRLQGRVAVVRAGERPAAQAAAAAAAGARAVLLAEPRERPLPAVPAGRVAAPVVGVTGAAARAVLGEPAGAAVALGASQPGRASPLAAPAAAAGGDAERPAPRLSPFSARGPSLAGTVKPDLAAPGAALTALAGGGTAVAGGTSVAAARAAAEAARLARARPRDTPAELRAALAGAAEPARGLPVAGAGAGALRRPPGAEPVLRTRRTPPLGPGPETGPPVSFSVGLHNTGREPLRVGVEATADPGARVQASPRTLALRPRGRAATTLTVSAVDVPAGAFALGRLVARDPAGRTLLSAPWRLDSGEPPPVPVGPLALIRSGGRVEGVRFTVGAFDRGDPLGAGTSLQAAERLDLLLVDERGEEVRRLTPTGGATELLPAEYAYRLPRATLGRLPSGPLRFSARARGPRQATPTTQTSEAFRP